LRDFRGLIIIQWKEGLIGFSVLSFTGSEGKKISSLTILKHKKARCPNFVDFWRFALGWRNLNFYIYNGEFDPGSG
jgi:hypothetical protein